MNNEAERYRRNLGLPGWSTDVQKHLGASAVLVVGAGGLGSPALYYLTAAGVGRIGIVEGDTVDVSNLQRQILYTTADTGRSKGPAAVSRLKALNPNISIDLYPDRLREENAVHIIAFYDIVLDCTDNLATRRLIHRMCRKTVKPWVHGAIGDFFGQVTTFLAEEGPCWHCLYGEETDREPPPPGVFSPVAGVIGSIQAAEAVKFLTGLGELLTGRLLVWDALCGRFDEMLYTRHRDCPYCSR